MEVMDYNEKFYVNYQNSRFKVAKSKDNYKLVAVNKSNGKTKTIFKGTEEECKYQKDAIDEAYQQGCLFYYFE